jgi:hypothetical protein
VCYIVENCTKVYPHKHSPYDYYELRIPYSQSKKSDNDYWLYDSWDEEVKDHMKEEVQFYEDFDEFLDVMAYDFGASETAIRQVWNEFHGIKNEHKTKRRKVKKSKK